MAAAGQEQFLAPSRTSGDTTGGGPRAVLLAVLMLALLLPVQPVVAGLRLDPFRLYLLLTAIPFAAALLSGRAGCFTLSDGMMFGFGFWVLFTYVYHHGMERFPYGTIAALELLGGYMAGRLLVRSVADYRRFVRYLLVALLVLFPFALYELLTARMLTAEILGRIFPAQVKHVDPNSFRFGLSRVQAGFPHAILFGLFCSVAIANVYYLYRNSLARMLPRLGLAASMTLMSLSSAAWLSMGLQVLLIVWGWLTRGRWWLLVGLCVFFYVVIDALSNRGPIIILIENLTLNPQTAWWRVHIWNFGTDNVLNNPVFGLGLNDWVRPYWLAPTIDNFWLVIAMRHGLPAIGMLGLAIALHVWEAVRIKDLDAAAGTVRTGYMVALTGLFFTLATVHVWDSVAVLSMFCLGAGAFFYTGGAQPAAEPADGKQPLPGGRAAGNGPALSRFPPRPARRA